MKNTILIQIDKRNCQAKLFPFCFSKDRNEIERISLPHPIETLSILKLSHNRLRVYDGLSFPNLRTLYLDNNRIEHVTMLSPMNALDTLSIRDQQCGGQQQT